MNTESRRTDLLWTSPDTSAYFVNFFPADPARQKAEVIYITYMGQYDIVTASVDRLRLESVTLAQEPRDYIVSCERKGLLRWPYIAAAPGAVVVALLVWSPWRPPPPAGIANLPEPSWPPRR